MFGSTRTAPRSTPWALQSEVGPALARLAQRSTSSTSTIEVPVDDTTSETLQTAASALGGAGVALAGFWIYRRRQPLND